jgi:hypothetical protein
MKTLVIEQKFKNSSIGPIYNKVVTDPGVLANLFAWIWKMVPFVVPNEHIPAMVYTP